MKTLIGTIDPEDFFRNQIGTRLRELLNVRLRHQRAYATWHPEQATIESDGRSDLYMVPIVEALRESGYTTYQSCFGHSGQSDGCLWIREIPPRIFDPTSFSRIQFVIHGPEGPHYEFHWDPENAAEAITEIGEAYLTGERP